MPRSRRVARGLHADSADRHQDERRRSAGRALAHRGVRRPASASGAAVSFRARLFLATCVAVLVPLTVLALGVRREMDRRLSEESRRRGDAAVRALGTELERERERVVAGLSALVQELSRDNRFRLAAIRGDPGSRSYLLDWAGDAMRLSGLSLLQLQDSAGRILSSGHF